jgi:hypothetical protein
MIEWLKQQYTKMLSNVFPTLPSYIARDCRDEFKEIYDVERLTENKRFEYEVTDTGQYYYDNGKRIFPEDFWQIIHDLNEENKQLKSDNDRLVNETAKIVAEHQKKILDLIDKSLEKDKQYYEMSYEDYLNGRIESLEDLKKELSE